MILKMTFKITSVVRSDRFLFFVVFKFIILSNRVLVVSSKVVIFACSSVKLVMKRCSTKQKNPLRFTLKNRILYNFIIEVDLFRNN